MKSFCFFCSALLTILLFACSGDEKKMIPVTSVEDVMTNLSPESKYFEIDPKEETVLKGKKGTSIYIPADAFLFPDGTTPQGKVEIELKECYSFVHMIGEGLSTTSGDRILQTGGMVYFTARVNGQELVLKKDKAFVVAFPKNKQTEEMDLFYNVEVNDTLTTWVPDYDMYKVEAMQAPNKLDTAPIDFSGMDKYPVEMTDDLYDVSFGLAFYTSSLLEIKVRGQDRSITEYMFDSSSFVRQLNDTSLVHFVANINKDGKFVNLLQDNDQHGKINPKAWTFVKSIFEKLPPVDVAHDSVLREDYEICMMPIRTLNHDRFKKKFREKYSKYINSAVEKMDKDFLDAYVFASTNMGWINCDKFWELKDDLKTNFAVNGTKDTRVQIIFNDIRSIMQGGFQNGQLIFPNVPLNRKVKVIAIKYENGQPLMSVTETTITDKTFVPAGFKAFTMNELEKQLNQLN